MATSSTAARKGTGRPRGRPKGPNPPAKLVSLRLFPEVREELRARADEIGISQAEVIRLGLIALRDGEALRAALGALERETYSGVATMATFRLHGPTVAALETIAERVTPRSAGRAVAVGLIALRDRAVTIAALGVLEAELPSG